MTISIMFKKYEQFCGWGLGFNISYTHTFKKQKSFWSLLFSLFFCQKVHKSIQQQSIIKSKTCAIQKLNVKTNQVAWKIWNKEHVNQRFWAFRQDISTHVDLYFKTHCRTDSFPVLRLAVFAFSDNLFAGNSLLFAESRIHGFQLLECMVTLANFSTLRLREVIKKSVKKRSG